jgi:hypothetical protein
MRIVFIKKSPLDYKQKKMKNNENITRSACEMRFASPFLDGAAPSGLD